MSEKIGQANTMPAGSAAVNAGAQYQQELWARCARGEHEATTQHGICGIICAICLFPIGLICLFTDVNKKCARCGVRL